MPNNKLRSPPSPMASNWSQTPSKPSTIEWLFRDYGEDNDLGGTDGKARDGRRNLRESHAGNRGWRFSALTYEEEEDDIAEELVHIVGPQGICASSRCVNGT